MTHFIGIDVHDDVSTLQHMDNDGHLGLQATIPTEPEAFARILDQLDSPCVVTFEAGRNYFWLYEFFSKHPKVSKVNVVDARRSRIICSALSAQAGYGRAKNDRIDAEMLTEESRRGLAPCIHVPTADQLERRSFNRHRIDLVVRRTSVINKTHGFLRLRGIRIAISELMDNSNSQQKVLDSLKLSAKIVSHYIAQIRQLQEHIIECDHFLDTLLPTSDPRIQLIMTVPGFGPVLARTVHTEILDIAYLKAPNSLINYSGLAPVENDSNNKKGVIRLNPYTNHYLKYAFVEAAHHASTHPRYRRKYQSDAKKHGKLRAKLNLARRLAKAVYWMLTRQQPFKP